VTSALAVLGGIAIAGGVLCFVAGTVGLLRLPDPISRLHALTKADSLGLGLIVLGLLPFAADVFAGLKLVVIWLLVLLSGATAGQMIAERLRRSDGDA